MVRTCRCRSTAPSARTWTWPAGPATSEAPGWRKVVTSLRDLLSSPGGGAAGAGGAAIEAVPHRRGGRKGGVAGQVGRADAGGAGFDNLSADPEMAFFSDGVSEEILQTVARGSELKVIGRGSSFQFRGRDKAAAHVGDALHATHVLDGSVRRSGAKVRISCSLIECARATTLWSDRFDRELSDVFALQDLEIAAARWPYRPEGSLCARRSGRDRRSRRLHALPQSP